MATERSAPAHLVLAPVDGGLASVTTWLGAALVLVSGLVHVHLWDIAYRHVATLGPLFILQAVLSILGAVALAIWRRMFIVLAVIGLMIGTIVGFVLVLTTGLFGFKLVSISGWAELALAAEIGAVILLSLVAWRTWARGERTAGRGAVLRA